MYLFVNGILLMTLLAALLMPFSEAYYQVRFFNSNYPGMCFISQKTILGPGEETDKSELGCSHIKCRSSSYAVITPCGLTPQPPHCKWGKPKNPNADYPDCCDRDFDCSD